MQPNYVMSFRKRLRNRGYRNISIGERFVDRQLLWLVSADEPLSGCRVEVLLSQSSICNMFR